VTGSETQPILFPGKIRRIYNGRQQTTDEGNDYKIADESVSAVSHSKIMLVNVTAEPVSGVKA
jgi:hypothetical protein